MSLQQKESFSSPRFTLLQRQSFMEKKNKNKKFNSFIIISLPFFFLEADKTNTQMKNAPSRPSIKFQLES